MTTNNRISHQKIQPEKIIIIGAIIGVIIVFMSACATKSTFQTSSLVPAARGYIKVKRDRNNNYIIRIYLSNLAEVERLENGSNVYVVWMETAEGEVKNIGRIISDTKMFSTKLLAYSYTVSAAKPTRVFITSENDGDARAPTSEVVLTTGNF